MTMTTQTTANPLSTVIGVFPDHERADRAIDELRHTHFSYEHIRVVEHGNGGFGDTLKGMFTGQAAMVSNASESLVKMGMPEYEAQYYQRELDADHVLVIMNADDRPEAAFSIMRQNGAFDINSRLKMSPTDSSDAADDAPESQTASHPQMPPAAAAPSVARDTTRSDGVSAKDYADGTRAGYHPTNAPAPDDTPASFASDAATDPAERQAASNT